MWLQVAHGSRRVGVLTRTRGRISFSYDDTWVARPDATPLSLSMPLAARDHADRVVTPWLWGLLPDSDPVLRRWARDLHTTTAHPLGLLSHQGRDLPGAFTILPEDEVPGQIGGSVTWLTSGDVGERLAAVRRDHTAWLGSSGEGRWSLAGAQAKIALRFDGVRWGLPTGAEPTTHILKPAVEGLDEHDLNEHLCLRAAALLGVAAARSTVQAFGDERAIVVERYDRALVDGRWVRVHQEDLCQALAIHPDRKYESDGGPGVGTVVDLLRRAIPAPRRHAEVRRFADALLLSWLLAAPDAHAKNYSVLLQGSDARLAPLYDVASALPYQDFHEPKIKLAMRIAGQYGVAQIDAESWRATADRLGLEADELIERGRELARALPDAISAVSADPLVAELGSDLPFRLGDRVADRARRCLERLT